MEVDGMPAAELRLAFSERVDRVGSISKPQKRDAQLRFCIWLCLHSMLRFCALIVDSTSLIRPLEEQWAMGVPAMDSIRQRMAKSAKLLQTIFDEALLALKNACILQVHSGSQHRLAFASSSGSDY